MKKYIMSLAILSFGFANALPPPPPPPPAPMKAVSYKEQEAARKAKALEQAKSDLKSAADYLSSNKPLDDESFAYINKNLRENCNVDVEIFEWKADKDLSEIMNIIKNEENVKSDEIAVLFDYDNTITRTLAADRKDVFIEAHSTLLNSLTDMGIKWGIITASRAQGPSDKYKHMLDHGVNLPADKNVESKEYLPTILTYKGDAQSSKVIRGGNAFDIGTIEYISCGDHVVLAGLPKQNDQFEGEKFIYNEDELIERYTKLGYGAGDGYQKPAAMRYFLRNEQNKKLIIIVDDNPRNIKDFVDDAKAKLLGSAVADDVKIIAIWYQPTEHQTKEYVKVADDLRGESYGMKLYQKAEQ